MKGLMKFLAKARLVELSDEEQAALAPETGPADAPESLAGDDAPVVTPPPPAPVSLPVSADGAIVPEGIGFDTIYTDAGLPYSPFPAERLMKLLDGLKSMDAATRKMAVLAMDAADDAWLISDPVNDALNKVRILDGYKQAVSERLREAEMQSARQIAEAQRAQEENAALIRKKITELEQLLQEDIAQSARQVSELESATRAARETAAREYRRVDQEIERLREIPATFGEPATPSQP